MLNLKDKITQLLLIWLSWIIPLSMPKLKSYFNYRIEIKGKNLSIDILRIIGWEIRNNILVYQLRFYI